MATWSTRTRTITRREWVVPVPSDHAQLLQAIRSAQSARAVASGKSMHDLSDDALMISAADGDEIVIWFETHALGPAL